MKPERLATLVADLKPNDLTADESVAFDVAYALVRGGTSCPSRSIGWPSQPSASTATTS